MTEDLARMIASLSLAEQDLWRMMDFPVTPSMERAWALVNRNDEAERLAEARKVVKARLAKEAESAAARRHFEASMELRAQRMRERSKVPA